MDNTRNIKKPIVCLCLSLLMALSLAACDKQAEEQTSTPPTASVQPTAEPTPTPPSIPFTDVPENSFYYGAVVWAYENGVTSGDTLFEPLSICTRGQVITFIWRAMGSPEPQITENAISDISPSDWFYKPVLWAYESGISTSSAFKPNSPCTNGEALTFLWRAEGKPAAAVHNSGVALAASGAYYERPTAWADNNGLFTQMGAACDPAAPCSRAYLMSYLCWAETQWTFAEEDKTVQAEYEKIVSDAQLYEFSGSGLCYAEYIDVEGDGKVELLTVEVNGSSFDITATVYANTDGHAGKSCETTLVDHGADDRTVYTYKADGSLYLCCCDLRGSMGMELQFVKIEKGKLTLENDFYETRDAMEYSYRNFGNDITDNEYNTILRKYTDERELFVIGHYGERFLERGLLPSPKEYWQRAVLSVNGAALKLSADPYFSSLYNEVMVPLRDVLEAMGVAVYANSDASVILASTKSDTLVITYKDFFDWGFESINSTYRGSDKTYKYSMNGGGFQNIMLEFTNGKAFLPLKTIASLFGATVEWGGKAGAMQITSNIPDSSRMTQDELKQVASFDMNQASRIAVNKGYKGEGDQAPTTRGGWLLDDSGYDSDTDVNGGLVFKNGKAVWSLYVVEREESVPGQYGYAELYRVDVASDGTVTAYPNDRCATGSGQL